MNLDLYSFRLAKEKLSKEITKLEKQLRKVSAQLYEMDDSNSTVRQRANKRMRLSQIGEDIYRHRDYLDELELKIEKEMRVNK